MVDPSFAATAAAALKRVAGSEGSREEVVLHVVGGQQHVEGNDDLWRAVLAAWRGQLRVIVVGPDMRNRPALLIETNLWVTHVAGAYECYGDAPDLVLAFHPGFWGYESWRPTLRGLLRGTTLLVATSYTPEEASLDALALGAAMLERDADEDAAEAASDALHWSWRPELNPHVGARREVASAPPGHNYRENHCWSAVAGGRAAAAAPDAGASGMLSLAHAAMEAQGPRPTYADFASNIPADNPFAQGQ